jgi:hypothetical protein
MVIVRPGPRGGGRGGRPSPSSITVAGPSPSSIVVAGAAGQIPSLRPPPALQPLVMFRVDGCSRAPFPPLPSIGGRPAGSLAIACFVQWMKPLDISFFAALCQRYIWSGFQCTFASRVEPRNLAQLGVWVNKFSSLDSESGCQNLLDCVYKAYYKCSHENCDNMCGGL